MKKVCLILAIAAALPNAYAVTATKEYVDRRDGEVAASMVPATNAAVVAANAYADAKVAASIVPATNAAVIAAKEYTDAVASNKADAVRASVDGQVVVSCDWWVGDKLLTWDDSEHEWLWSSGFLGGSCSLSCDDGHWRYFKSVTPFAYTNAVPIYGLPPSLVLYKDGDSVTLTRTNEVYAAATNIYPVAYLDDVAKATNALTAADVGAVPETRTINGQPLTGDITIASGVTSVNGATGTVTLAASDVGAYSSTDGVALAGQVATAKTNAAQALQYASATFSFMNANTNAWFAGTNYTFGAQAESKTKFAFEDGMNLLTMPCSMALYEMRDGSRQQVWDQRDWVVWFWNFKSAQMRASIAETNAVIVGAVNSLSNAMPSKAWSKYTAAGGLDNADTSTTWIDTPKVTLAPGMAWETVAEVEGCAYWTIVGNAAIGGEAAQQTNGVLTIRDFEGKPVMRIRKGESYQAFLECGSEIYTSGSDAQGRVTFTMRASVQPTGMFSTVLDDTLFVEETDEGCPVNYEWETVSQGVYRCHFLLKPGILSTACFAKFKVAVEGSTTIEYTAAPTISGGLIYQGVKIAPVIPANPSVGDTITWKVVQ